MVRTNTPGPLVEEITAENCGQKLDLICRAAGITATELAEYLGELPASLCHIKSGRSKDRKRTAFLHKLRALAGIRPKDAPAANWKAQALTAAAVVAGLSLLARTRLLGKASVLVGTCVGGLAGGLLSIGMLHALDAICRKLGLAYRESKQGVEITKQSKETESC